ncbi:MAG: sensor histidine kinase [Acetatifactor sp.]
MKKLQVRLIGYIVLLILAGAMTFYMCKTTNQAAMTIVLHAEFVGEYSQGGSEWRPLDKNTKLSAFDGDLVLRGKLGEPGLAWLNFYMNHIGVTIYADGEPIYVSGRAEDAIPEMMCGSYWSGWLYEADNPEETIEIRLHNPHSYGNADAYNEFLDSLYWGNTTALQKHLKQESMPYQIAGIFILVVSIALFGTALGYLGQRLPYGSLLWSMGALSLFMSIYILLDTKDIEFRSGLIIFNTCMRQCSIMFFGLELATCIRKTLTGKAERIAGILTSILGTVDGILLILAFAGVVSIYDTGLYCAVAQGTASLMLLGLCVGKLKRGEKSDRVLLISYVILLAALLLELANGRLNFWPGGIAIKIIFVLLFLFHLFRAIRLIAFNHQESLKAKELAGELRNSRITLAMSQIRTHFIFNVLNAISGMCKYDAEKADETVVRFARYLRSNIDIMQEDEPIPFSREMEHLQDYVVLEQVRFGDKIRFVTDIQTADFLLPPLVLQPIVENSIKHGLLAKSEGGTISLGTREENGIIIITIQDDGVGFQQDEMPREGSVGIQNVRFRLKYMVNGRMDIESSPGKGTTVTITVPRFQRRYGKEAGK